MTLNHGVLITSTGLCVCSQSKARENTLGFSPILVSIYCYALNSFLGPICTEPCTKIDGNDGKSSTKPDDLASYFAEKLGLRNQEPMEPNGLGLM